MAWRDDLLPGSFRGVAFNVRSHEAEGGRRTASHEYPLRDEPFEEDLGRKQRSYSLDVFLLGDDYMRDRDALAAACDENSTPGRLVHPYLGIKNVVCKSYRISESTEEGRMCRFSLVLVEAGEKKFPTAGADFFGRLGIAADGFLEAAREGFETVMTVLSFPAHVAENAANLVRTLGGVLEGISGIAGGFTDLAQAAKGLVDDAVDLVKAPAELAERIVDSIKMIGGIDLDLDSIGEAYKSLFDFGDDLGTVFSPPAGEVATSRRQDIKNRAAITDLVKQAAVAGAAVTAADKARNSPGPGRVTLTIDTPLDPLEISPTRLFPTYESALHERDEIFEALDRQMEATTDDNIYLNLQKLRNATAQALPDPTADLPNLIDLENADTQPSLRLVYELYGALDFEIDLLQRNRVEHPGFVPGGTTLQVLRDA